MGSLYLIGTGIRLTGQLTLEARNVLRGADVAFALAGDSLALAYLRELNPRIESLEDCYRGGRTRDESYEMMVERLLAPLDDARTVCAAFYGHPGVFVWPSHEAVRRARQAGHCASMLPGVSSEDCLVADLGVDPGVSGMQTYEAGDFLVYRRAFDARVPLVLWQVGALGDRRSTFRLDPKWLQALVAHLITSYTPEHEVIVYEAAAFPLDAPRVDRVPLRSLLECPLSQVSTLYVPPLAAPELDVVHLRALGLDETELVEAVWQRHRRALAS
ncbi:MAG: SAM-dependent methyltransferase [Pseudomonadota bacterium]